MNAHKRKKLCLAVITALGTVAVCQQSAAAVIADGHYQMVINPTPTTVFQGSTFYLSGSDGAWNSTFTLGSLPSSALSHPMTDNGANVTGSDAIARGSSLAGDSYAGTIGITVTGGSFTVSSFQVDAIFATCCGTFVQYTDPSIHAVNMGGTIDQSTGAMSFFPTGRLGAFSAINTFFDRRWNVNDADTTTCSSSTGCGSNGNTIYSSFTTGSTSNAAGSVNGAAITAIGDVNGDSITDYTAILVSGSHIGADWGGLAGVTYFETWNVRLLSQPVPIPATAWLFGSGLFGLAALARRKKQA